MKQPTVIFNPTDAERGGGLSCQIAYKHPKFLKALEQIIELEPNEKIRQIEILPTVIEIRIETTE